MRGPRLGIRFRLAYLALAAVAASALTVALIMARAPHPRPHTGLRHATVPQRNWPIPAYPFAEARWGKLHAGSGSSELVLGPRADARSHVQIRVASVRYGAGVAIADTEPGAKVPLDGGPTAAGCLSHFQGGGVNVVMAVGDCVPFWALVRGHRAAEWVLVENARPTPVAVYVESAPGGWLYQRRSPTARAR
jgi:hypothetical protein